MENKENSVVLEDVTEKVINEVNQEVNDICNIDTNLCAKSELSYVKGTIGILIGMAAVGIGMYFIHKEIKRIKEQKKTKEEN